MIHHPRMMLNWMFAAVGYSPTSRVNEAESDADQARHERDTAWAQLSRLQAWAESKPIVKTPYPAALPIEAAGSVHDADHFWRFPDGSAIRKDGTTILQYEESRIKDDVSVVVTYVQDKAPREDRPERHRIEDCSIVEFERIVGTRPKKRFANL